MCFPNLEGREACINHPRVCMERLLERKGKTKTSFLLKIALLKTDCFIYSPKQTHKAIIVI